MAKLESVCVILLTKVQLKLKAYSRNASNVGKLWLGCCDFVSQSSKQGSQQLQTQCNWAKYFLKSHEFEFLQSFLFTRFIFGN